MRSETRAVPVELLREWKAFVAHHHTINASPGGDAAQDRIASEMQALLDAEPAEPDAEELLDWLGEQEGATLWSSKLEWISGWVMSPSVDSGEAVCSATPKACIRAAHAADKEKK